MIGLLVLGGAVYVGTKLVKGSAQEAGRTFKRGKDFLSDEEISLLRERRPTLDDLSQEEKDIIVNHRMKEAVRKEVLRRGDTFR